MTVWLAMDTATDVASVALHDGSVLAESTWTSRRRHTVELAPRVERMLIGQGLTATDLAGIAVAIGPGSYTGLRISLSLAKGIALGLGTPVVGVPTLDILAANLAPRIGATGGGDLHAVLRAGRGRIVAGRYRIGGDMQLDSPSGIDPAAVAGPGARPGAHAMPGSHPGLGQAESCWRLLEAWPDPSELFVETVTELADRVAELADRIETPAWVAGELDGPARDELADAGMLLMPPEMSVRRAGWLAALGSERALSSTTSVADLSPVYLGGDGT